MEGHTPIPRPEKKDPKELLKQQLNAAIDAGDKEKARQLLEQVLDLKTPIEEKETENAGEEKPNQEVSVEKRREELAVVVREKLEQFKEELQEFYFHTTSATYGGFAGTEKMFIGVPSWRNDIKESLENTEFHGVDPQKSHAFPQGVEIGYIKNKSHNWYGLVHNIGRALHTPDRLGNFFAIGLKFKEVAPHAQEIVDSIMELLATLKSYQNFSGSSREESRKNVERDLAEIAKQGIPVLRAFEDISTKVKSRNPNEIFKISDLIEEYKSLYEQYKDALQEMGS